MSQTLTAQVWAALSEATRLHASGKHHGHSSPSTCKAPHSGAQLALSIFLCVGIVASYLPQIYRLVSLKTSAGFSPWFLLLGATSSASVFLNVLSLQWGVVRCCSQLSAGACIESLLGLTQVGLQWLLFNVILVLFLVYFPRDRRYERAISLPTDDDESDEGSSLESGEEYSEEDDSGIRAPDSTGSGSNVTVQDGHLAPPAGAAAAGRKSPGTSGLSLASDELSEEEEDDPSSSAFTGLVPTFWPVWKAPARGGPGAGSARYPNVGGRGAPTRPPTTSTGGGGPWLRKLVGVRNMSRGEAANAQGAAKGAATEAPSSAPATPPIVAADASEPGSATPTAPANNGKSKSVQIHVPSASDSGVTTVQPGVGGESGFSAIVAHASAAFGFGEQRRRRRVKRKTAEWSTAMGVGWATGIHFVFTLLITLLLVSTLPPASFPSPSEPPSLPLPGPIPPSGGSDFEVMGPSSRRLLNRWAAFLGGTATLLATAQYLPQIWFTARAGLVGSLSIPMMCLQVPGSIIFIYSLSLRPGVNITSLAAYICTGILQGVLLLICIVFKIRQRRAGIDDFGNPLPGSKASLLQQQQQQQRQVVSEPSSLATVAE